MEKRNLRSVLKINENVKIATGIKAYKDGLISNIDRVAPFIETLMRMYLDGKLEDIVKKVDNYKSDSVIRTSHIDKTLKNDFAISAYDNGLIKSPRYAVRLIEDIMRIYIKGELDKILKDA